MYTLFISDLHLSPVEPEITAVFLQLLETWARQADALYILGDLFESWIGDDDTSPFIETVIAALRSLTQAKITVYIMQGNRDFLLGKDFLAATGCQLLPDPTVINLYGIPTLLMHGDTLCTADTAYLRFRHYARNPFYQRCFLTLPLFLRRFIAAKLRKSSQKHAGNLLPEYMDANQAEINRVMQHHAVKLLIHGHTHLPCIEMMLGTPNGHRIVLSDWHQSGNMLIYYNDARYRLLTL